MKRINISIVFAVAILAIGSFVFISNNSSAAINCSLSLLDKNGNSISQVIAGDTVTWRFKAHINNLRVFWYGSKDGKKDIWDKTNGYFSNSSYSGAIYKNGEEGSYSRYVAFKNDVGKTICVSNPVNFSVTNGIITKAEIPTVAKPETSGPKITDFLRGEISGATSLTPYTGNLDFNCDGSVAIDDVDAITNLWRSGTVLNITTITSLGKTCANLGAYIGYLWRNGVATISTSELTRLAVAIKAQTSATPTPTPVVVETSKLSVSLSSITPSSAELLAGAKSVKLVTADLTVSNSADVLLTNLVPVLTYENNSNRVKSGLTNFRLIDENNNLVGTSYGNDAWMNGEVIYFKDLKFTITKGTIRRLSLIADLNEKSTHIPSFKAEIWGSTYMGAQNYTTGQYVPTTGKATGNIMTIASLPTTPTPTPVPLANGQKILVLQLKYSDTPASKVVWTKNQINELVFGKVQDFYKRVSYDKVHFSGDISNLYTISRNAKDGVYDDCRPDIGSVDSEVYKLLKNDYNLENYDSLMMVLYVPDYCNLRSWGSSNSMNNISGMRDPDFRIGVTLIRADIGDYDGIIAHELGHTLFNLKHAKSRFCEAGQYITGSNCVETEAGNFFDIMGSDLQLSSSNFNALLKERMGWLDNLSLLKIDKSGTYTINTIEATSGYRAAKLVNNAVNNNRPIYIEYRQLDPARYSFKLDGLIVNIPLTVNDTDWPLLNGSTLIDMTPTGISPNDEQDVTLRRSDLIPSGQSKTFLYQNWGIELGPVLSNNDKQITFNVRVFDPLTLAPTPAVLPSVASLPIDLKTPIDPGKVYTTNEIHDGDIIRGESDIAVWIIKVVGEKKFKRWLFGPQLFKIYGHLGFNKVKNVTKVTLSQFDTTNLIRKDGDEKVYELTDYIPGVQAIKRWVPSYEVFLKRGFDKDAIYTVNDGEFALYKLGSRLQY